MPMSMTYVAAHGNARSLTHGARPEIERILTDNSQIGFWCSMKGTPWYLILVLICSPLMICNFEHLYLCLFTICVFSLVRCLLELLPIFKSVCFVYLLLSFKRFLFLFFCFLGPHSWHMEVPRLGVLSELCHSCSNMGSKPSL